MVAGQVDIPTKELPGLLQQSGQVENRLRFGFTSLESRR